MSPKRPSLKRDERFSNLYRDPMSGFYWFRKWSSEKGKEYVRSTREKSSAAKAYRIGLDGFNEWLGRPTTELGEVKFDSYARRVLDAKLANPALDADTKGSYRNQIEVHLIPTFGHLRLSQVTAERWEEHYTTVLRETGPKKFFNERKALRMILLRAFREGLIKQMPEFENPDPETKAGRIVTFGEFYSILQHSSQDTAALMQIVYYMGARPGEALQYRYDMVDWQRRQIAIPAAITKTRRARTIPINRLVFEMMVGMKAAAESEFLFPSPGHPEKPIQDYSSGWTNACARAGIRVNIYSLRHTYLTEAARKNVNVMMAARYADTSVAMLERHYFKPQPEDFRSLAEVMG